MKQGLSHYQLMENQMATFQEFQEQVIARLESRIQDIESTAVGAATSEDAEDLANLREQLQQEKGTLDRWSAISNLAPSQPAPSPGGLINAVVIGGAPGRTVYEKDWRSVFEFFPGTQAAFQEIVTLDTQEEQLFQDRHDPALRPTWQQTRSLVIAKWEPFKQDILKKLAFLGKARDFTVTIQGEVKDDDNFSDDEYTSINQAFPNTMRFGEVLPINHKWEADSVSLRLNASCRFEVGDEDGPPILGISGSASCYDGDDERATVGIDAHIRAAAKSGEFMAGKADDDYGKATFLFDIR
jgi:hypothetical protein